MYELARKENHNMKTITTLAQFKKLVAENEYVLVSFYAEWRDSCRTMHPILQNLAEHNAGRIVVAKIDVNNSPESSILFDALGVPDLYLFKSGSVIEKLSGHFTLDILEEKVEKLISEKFSDIPPRGH